MIVFSLKCNNLHDTETNDAYKQFFLSIKIIKKPPSQSELPPNQISLELTRLGLELPSNTPKMYYNNISSKYRIV